MSFRRYRDTKPSGALWLGDIPSSWQVKRLKYLCAVLPSNVDKKTYEGELPVKLCNYTDAYYNEEITADLEFMSATATPEQVSRFSLRSGDSIVTKDSETSDDIAVASYVPKDLPGVVCGYHLAIVRPKGPLEGRYVKRLFDSKYLKSRFDVAANGLTRVGLSQYAFDNVEVPLPPRDEQDQIVAFLERETQRIDALVAQQERLVELLKEKRRAVISHAVTRGLNPDAPMRQSGVDWLGQFPLHWKMKRLKHISPAITVGIVVNPSSYVADEGLPFIYGGDISEGRIAFENARRISRKDSDRNAKTRLRAGDLLTVRVGAPGVTAVVGEECEGGNCASVMHICRGDYDSRWLSFAMNSRMVRFQVEVVQYGAAQEQFNIGHAVDFWIAVPPREEQTIIAKYLTEQTQALAELACEAERAIDLLKERRAVLISAAVTGQIDVRELAPAEIA